MKILLVEDEKNLSAVLIKGLKKLSYAVDAAYDGEEALELIEINSYDLVILDLNLPVLDGLEVLRQVRKIQKEIKILILSARNLVEDKIQGLDLGANDYLEKPFDFQELAARIRNLLRWNFVKKDTFSTFRELTVDIASQNVFVRENQINLTNKEYAILEYLIQYPDRYISAEELIEHVWDSDADLFSNTFKFHIHSLKKKLGLQDLIINVRGKGYKLNVKETT